MTNITLFLPVSTYETLAGVAKSAGVEIAHFCSNILTDFAADNRREGHSTNGYTIHASKLGDSKPDKAIPEIQLVEDIVMFLRKQRGSATKVKVEEAVFEKNKNEFPKTYWQKPLVGGQLRWKKNTGFASNTARKMGLLKTPEDSGRGVWQLTEKGWKWKFE